MTAGVMTATVTKASKVRQLCTNLTTDKPKEVGSQLVKMWPQVQETREERTTSYTIFSFPSSFLVPYYNKTIQCWSHIRGNMKRLVPSILKSADWNRDRYTMKVPHSFWKLLIVDHRKWQCLHQTYTCTIAKQETWVAVNVTKHPCCLHSVHIEPNVLLHILSVV
jgi:hypothetical protein